MNKIILGDSIQELKKLNCKVDLIFADLPFNWQGGTNIGKNRKERYYNFIDLLVKETTRLLKEGGNYIVINNPTNLYETAEIYRKNGLIFRNGVPLIRPAQFRCAWHLGFKHNYLWFLVKGHKKNWYGSRKHHSENHIPDVWDDIRYQNGYRDKNGFHPQAIREDLTTRIIELTTKEGDLILDPFLGSGTTAVVCKKLNRQLISIELNEKYINMAKKRLKNKKRIINNKKIWRSVDRKEE